MLPRNDDGDGSLPDNALLHRAFIDRASAEPEAAAVFAHDRVMTYGELATESALLATELARRGVGSGSLVGVVMDKGWEQIVGCLAVLRSGAAYVPIDPHWPASRAAAIFENAAIDTALTQPELLSAVTWPERCAVCVVEPATGALEATAPDVTVSPHDLAYVIFTSGSTGAPKGVMIEHGPAVNTVQDVNDEMELTERDRILALSALHFDLSVYDIFGPLSAGGAVVVPPPGEHREPGRWLALIAEHSVTVWNSVPALMAMLCAYLEENELRPPTELRIVLMSGDWIPVTLPKSITRYYPYAEQWSLGGATEASIWSIWHRIEPEDSQRASIPYGRSMRRQRVYVADQWMQPRPCWVAGEIVIAGVGLARGYIADPDRTARSFVTDPKNGTRLYRTGDWGRLLPSGEIEFLGRDDMQVKIGGHRIELGDIEAALIDCPGIRTGVATVQGQRSNARLAVHVITEADVQPSAVEIRQALRERLPEYMVPAVVTFHDGFPLTSNGKVDRKALVEISENAEAPIEPTLCADEEEQLLLTVWTGFFGNAHIAVTDNFFELGGDSLRAVRLMAAIRRSTGVELPISVLFEYPTISDLARRLREDATGTRTGEQQRTPRAQIVTITAGRDQVPMVFAHPVGGEVLCYAELGHAMGPQQPFFAVQRPNHDQADRSFGDLVSEYAEAILTSIPGGHYRLGGWSMGAILALELSRELQQRGAIIDSVAAVDVTETPASLGLGAVDGSPENLLNWLGRDLAGLTGCSWPAENHQFTVLPELHRALIEAAVIPPDLEVIDLNTQYERFAANARALANYRPEGQFSVPVYFLQADSGGRHAAAEGWRNRCSGPVEISVLGADHYTVLKTPHVTTVASHLKRLYG